jgi:aminoglycoside 6'-N-acetyltransferase
MPQYAAFPPDTRAIDMFLGDPDYLGQGHASGFITARLADLKHIGTIVIDPDPTNTRAIRAYEKAGFRPDKITACEDGDPVHVMVYP